jgi:hypothetical protein
VKISLSLKVLNNPLSLTELDKKFLSLWKDSIISGKELKLPESIKTLTFKSLSKMDLKNLSENFKFSYERSFSNFALSEFSFELCQILNDGFVNHTEQLLISGGLQPLRDTTF